MNYHEAVEKLTGRCYESRKLCNNTYLKRREYGAIAVRLHSTDVVTFYPDGRTTLHSGGWLTITTKGRINAYLPHGYRVYSDRGQWFLYDCNSRNFDRVCTFEEGVTIHPNGEVTGGRSVEEWEKEWREEYNYRQRVRNRARYWVRKARQHEKARNLTVEGILAERNIAIRVAKMHVYGIEKFLLDANAAVTDANAGYEVIRFKLDSWRDLVALKMRCPSTGTVYVSTMPPHIRTVAAATDWYFNVKGYLARIAQQA